MTALPSALILSLDFELHWGIRDHACPDDPTLQGAREAVRQLLALFAEREIACTWATVGFLFAGTEAERRAASPELRPTYQDGRLDPYAETVGRGEADDPVHFAASLVESIRRTPRQELATHTFSHFYCGEPGASIDAFRADLVAAQRSAPAPLRSIVFPRNQSAALYLAVLREVGLDVYRGNPPGGLWRAESGASGRRAHRRLLRLADAYLPLMGDDTVTWESVPRSDTLADVRASRFLRPYSPRLRALEPLRIRRIVRGMEAAARHGRLYHLWWHPYNFGTHLEENLDVLGQIFDAFDTLRDRHGMDSLTMAEAADLARSLVEARQSGVAAS